MSWDDLRELAARDGRSARTRARIRTCRSSTTDAIAPRADGVARGLRARDGPPCRSVAYPFGEADDRVRAAAAERATRSPPGCRRPRSWRATASTGRAWASGTASRDWRFRIKVSPVTAQLRGSRAVTALDASGAACRCALTGAPAGRGRRRAAGVGVLRRCRKRAVPLELGLQAVRPHAREAGRDERARAGRGRPASSASRSRRRLGDPRAGRAGRRRRRPPRRCRRPSRRPAAGRRTPRRAPAAGPPSATRAGRRRASR